MSATRARRRRAARERARDLEIIRGDAGAAVLAVPESVLDEARHATSHSTVVRDLAHAAAFAQALMVERRILAGENVVEVRDASGHRVRWIVPAWSRRPIFRVRLALARRRARRGVS